MAWAKLDTISATTTQTNLTSATYTTKKFIQTMTHLIGFNAPTDLFQQFNTDTSNNYARRRSTDGGADATYTSQSAQYVGWSPANSGDHFTIQYIIDIPTEEKLSIIFNCYQNISGAGYAPNRTEFVAKWVNTSDGITEDKVKTGSTQVFSTDSNHSTLGTD